MVKPKKEKGNKKVATVPLATSFASSLEALKSTVDVVVNGTVPEKSLIEQIRYYLDNLQNSSELVNLVFFHHSLKKQVEIMEGIAICHAQIMDKQKLEDRIKSNPEYGLKLLGLLYREAGQMAKLMESKAKTQRVFDGESLKKAEILNKGTDSEEVIKKATRLSSSRRENLRSIVGRLLEGKDNN
jgi:hypothetical protein